MLKSFHLENGLSALMAVESLLKTHTDNSDYRCVPCVVTTCCYYQFKKKKTGRNRLIQPDDSIPSFCFVIHVAAIC